MSVRVWRVHVQGLVAVRVQVVVKVRVLVSAKGSGVELVDLCVELCL